MRITCPLAVGNHGASRRTRLPVDGEGVWSCLQSTPDENPITPEAGEPSSIYELGTEKWAKRWRNPASDCVQTEVPTAVGRPAPSVCLFVSQDLFRKVKGRGGWGGMGKEAWGTPGGPGQPGPSSCPGLHLRVASAARRPGWLSPPQNQVSSWCSPTPSTP